ncbi:MAG: MucBP domain-containing protein, partial [Lactobacillaceae bacterium]
MGNNTPKHFKMYKDGKQWVVAGLTLATIFIGSSFASNNLVYADSTTDPSTTVPTTNNQSNLVVQYVDTDNKPLVNSDTFTKTSGESYSTTPKAIDGYNVVTTPSNATGQYSADGQTTTVTYVYAKIQDVSVSKDNLNTAVTDTKTALDKNVTDPTKSNVTEDTTAAKTTNIQGTDSADSNAQVKSEQDSDNADYQKQIADLKDAQEKETAYETAINTGKKTNADGKTQIATSGNEQALDLDKSKPADETAPTSNIQPTDVYAGNDPKKGTENTKESTKIWEYSGAQVLGATITKTWANAGTIAVRDENGQIVKKSVDLTETFHDFQLQNGNWSDTNNYKESGIPKVKISSNAIDNIEVFNVNWQTTFWFTYSDTKEIVPISKMTGTNGDPKVYFLSGSLSSSVPYNGPSNPGQWDGNNWIPNRREYVQTSDAKTAVIEAGSTIGLGKVSGDGIVTNAPGGQAYTNITDQFHDGDDYDPNVFALKEGVSFTDFTTDTPTLYLGAVPYNTTARWWHSNKNMNSDELAFVQKPKATYHYDTISYTQVPVTTVKEKINYVDEAGKTLDTSYETDDNSNKKFVTLTRTNADGTQYQETWTTTGQIGTNTIGNPTVVKTTTKDADGKDVITETITGTDGWTKSDNNDFAAVTNPTIKGYHVIKTTDVNATEKDLKATTKQTVTKNEPNQLREITVTYAKDQSNLVVNYVDTANKPLAESDKATKDSGSDYTTTAKPIAGYD